jgi:hypothetical protein
MATNSMKTVAIVLIAAGAAGLAYGSFTYTRDSQTTKLGPIELTVKDEKTVNIPVWAGIAAIAVGAGLMLSTTKKG